MTFVRIISMVAKHVKVAKNAKHEKKTFEKPDFTLKGSGHTRVSERPIYSPQFVAVNVSFLASVWVRLISRSDGIPKSGLGAKDLSSFPAP